MKNLANCKPSEFLKQTNLIKKSVERWLTDTDILNIRKRQAVLKKASDDMSIEERRKIGKENDKLVMDQAKANFSAMLDAVLDEHPEETLEVLALVCFVDPKDVDNHPVSEYLSAIAELLDSKAVIDFFTSLAKWVVPNTSAQ